MIKNYKMEIVEKLRGTIQVQAEDEDRDLISTTHWVEDCKEI